MFFKAGSAPRSLKNMVCSRAGLHHTIISAVRTSTRAGKISAGTDLPKTGHQVDQHLRRHQLAFRQSCHVAVMDHFMESYKGMAIRVALIATLPVHQQGPAQPEVLTRADVHGDIHRRGP